MTPPRLLVVAAAGAYAANLALGTAVRSGLVDTSRRRWTHHALYVATTTLTLAAIGGSLAAASPRAFVLAPSLVPLAMLPRVGRDAHAVVGLAALPWYAGALLVDRD